MSSAAFGLAQLQVVEHPLIDLLDGRRVRWVSRKPLDLEYVLRLMQYGAGVDGGRTLVANPIECKTLATSNGNWALIRDDRKLPIHH
jgi:hypothetical protein